MLCPICKVDLVIADRQGIEIDYCPKCRGVWLDRGELDKLIERAGPDIAAAPVNNSMYATPAPGPAYPPPGRGYEYDDDDDDDRYRYGNQPYGGPYQKRRKGFLGDFFDFD